MSAPMNKAAILGVVAAAVVVVGGVGVWRSQTAGSRAASADSVNVDSGSIGGVVLNGNGPKPACGSIAEPRACRRTSAASWSPMIVGRFLVPDLPAGPYESGFAATG